MHRQRTRIAFEFGEFRLDPQRRVLIARGSGEPVPMTGKVFDTLLYLVEHAGELLGKSALMEALWPNVVVEEANLTQTIHTLRRKLGERPGEHRYIVTVPGRGYRFVADVVARPMLDEHRDEPTNEPRDEPTAEVIPGARTSKGSKRTHAAVALGLAMLAGVLGVLLKTPPPPPETEPSVATPQRTVSLAVLPFVDMSSEQDQAYFADGLAEEILNLLAQSSSMRIIARTSSFSFKDRRNLDAATIARQLQATHVLEGSVRKSGNRVRVTAQLVDGTTSGHLWSQTYDRDVTDIFSVQDEIAATVTHELHAKLQNGKELHRADTTSAEAFEQYLNGRYFFNRGGEADIARARNYFQNALKRDPSYAPAWAGLAATYHSALDSGQQPDSKLKEAWQKSIEQGLSLGPGIAEVHVRAAQYYWWLGDLKTSDEHCKVAIALNPSDTFVLSVSASKAIVMGHHDEALALQRRAVAVDPVSAPGRAALGRYLTVAGELQQAEAEFRHAKELSPTLPEIDSYIANVLILQQRVDEAKALIEEMVPGPMRDQGLALVNHAAKDHGAADFALAALTARADATDAEPSLKIRVAEVHAFRGDHEQAIRIIDQLFNAPDNEQVHVAAWLKHEVLSSPFFAALKEQGWRKNLVEEGR
jgi:TolB-like protein/DNA-binding winged helix-turn-helix (wHTH) protein/Flp pilus assembly protein TadD